MPRLYVGIDPGKNGGLAALSSDGEVLDLCRMPETPEGILDWLSMVLSPGYQLAHSGHVASEVRTALEQVGGYTKSTGPQPGAYMFEFGRSFGWVEMALVVSEKHPRPCSVNHVLVPAVRWQKDLKISPRRKDEPRPAFKRRLKQTAEKLFPDVKLTLATADALLLAEWCRRKFTGELQKNLLD